MPSIEMIGFSESQTSSHPESLKNKIIAVIKAKDSELASITVIVTHHESRVTSCEGAPKPFLRICAVDAENFEKLRQIITTIGNYDIEHLKMENFFPVNN